MEENWDDPNAPQQASSSQKYDQSKNKSYNNNLKYSSNNYRQTKCNNGDSSDPKIRRNFSKESLTSNEKNYNFFIETSKLGKLIGKGGSNIKELEEQSGTKIIINKECQNGDSTQIVVIGSNHAQNQVKSMIDEFLSDRQTGIYSNDLYQNFDTSSIIIDWDQAAKDADEFQKQKWAQYSEIKKNFYIEDIEISKMTKEQVELLRKENNNIDVQYTFDISESEKNSVENHIPNPIQTFEQAFKNYPDILREIKKQGFLKPSPIQCQAWPILLSGKDMIGIAQTGTGKTLAFLLPALIHIDCQEIPSKKRTGPTVLVMAPTRELALQIEKEVKKYDYHGIKAVCIYGGASRKEQINTVSKGIEIVIATPGRLNDLIQTGVLDVKCVSYLVLDEADRMLDMGFEPQIRKFLLDIRPDRQSIMTSATWPPGVRRLAQSYMTNPITVCVGSLDLKAVHSVTQRIYIIEEEEKNDYLNQFFQNMDLDDKVIVFFGKKAKVDDVGSDLALNGIKCQSIHGNRDQSDREQALEDIKSGDVHILLATDVASRGIDIEDITHVLNYDFPRDIEEYVHRVGRTGRAGRTGESISFMTRRDWSQAAGLIKILEEAEQEVPDELYSMSERYEAMIKKKGEERNSDRRNGRRYGNSGGRGKREGNHDRESHCRW